MNTLRLIQIMPLLFIFCHGYQAHIPKDINLNDSVLQKIRRQHMSDTLTLEKYFSSRAKHPAAQMPPSFPEMLQYIDFRKIDDIDGFKYFFGVMSYLIILIVQLYLLTWKLVCDFRRISSYDSLQPVDAKITRSVIEYTGITGDSTMWPEIDYEYIVNGKTYKSSKIPFYFIDFLRVFYIKSLVKWYPLGSTTIIYYDPKNPADSYLIRRGYSPRFADYIICVLISIMIIWVLLLTYFTWTYGWIPLPVAVIGSFFNYKGRIRKIKSDIRAGLIYRN